jgi:hypothetical protein
VYVCVCVCVCVCVMYFIRTQVVWEGAEEEESMRVLYLDRDLLILQDDDADEGGSMPYVLQVAS